jgi:hypothetical protein
MPSLTLEHPSLGSPGVPPSISAYDGLPVTHSLTLACGASLLIAALIALASAVGLTRAAGDVYADSESVLVSRGADVANLLLVPLLLGTM